MPTFEIDNLDDWEDWTREKLSGALKRGLFSAAIRAVGVIQNELIPAENPQPVDRGAYRAGWRAEETPRGADVVNDMPVAPIIDGGARPENIKIGRAMIEALAEWAKRKGFSPRGIPKGGSPEKAYESIAWAIATNMKKNGIFKRDGVLGLHITDKMVVRLKGFLGEEIAREMNRSR